MRATAASVLALAAIASVRADNHAQMTGLNGFSTAPIFTIGETINGYIPPGVPDGMAAYDRGEEVYLLVNHELRSRSAYPYVLANGTVLAGARVSTFVIDKATRRVTDAALAYDTIHNRAGEIVDGASDLRFGGLNRLCSAFGVEAGTYGFVDAIFFTGEESAGGTEWALDVANGELWAAPALGVGAWESVTPLAIPSINKTHVALLLGDDRDGAPLYLYVGDKKGSSFLGRNGLADGKLYMWKADDGSRLPSDFTGTGTVKKGTFVEVDNTGDNDGYASQRDLDARRDALGAFRFSRPEDLHTNPFNGSQVVFASTGRSRFDAADSWGTTYLIDVKLSRSSLKGGRFGARIRVAYDGDDFGGNGLPHPSFGIRNPDNLCWALDENAYIQEDRSVGGFGAPSGEEASIWRLGPHSSATLRVARMNRGADLPFGQTDRDPLDLGDWESSGIIDVSPMFGKEDGSLFLFNVQAHSVRNGNIASENLVQGGQILFLGRD
jgi:hypothetical protein